MRRSTSSFGLYSKIFHVIRVVMDNHFLYLSYGLNRESFCSCVPSCTAGPHPHDNDRNDQQLIVFMIFKLVLFQVLAVHPLSIDHLGPHPPLHPGLLQRGSLGYPQQEAQHSSEIQSEFFKAHVRRKHFLLIFDNLICDMDKVTSFSARSNGHRLGVDHTQYELWGLETMLPHYQVEINNPIQTRLTIERQPENICLTEFFFTQHTHSSFRSTSRERYYIYYIYLR